MQSTSTMPATFHADDRAQAPDRPSVPVSQNLRWSSIAIDHIERIMPSIVKPRVQFQETPLLLYLEHVLDDPTVTIDVDQAAQTDNINSLLEFLWCGDDFDNNDDNAFQKAYERLSRNLVWIQQIRQDYAPNHVAKPVSTKHIFTPDETTEIHNTYMNSLTWMPEDVLHKYYNLQTEGNPARRAHKLKKQTFNVCFFKNFGSKQLFWYLVKVGPGTTDLPGLLREWKQVKSSDKYQRLLKLSKKKVEREVMKKRERRKCQRQMTQAFIGNASQHEIQQAVDAYKAAESSWKALDRNTEGGGMHELLGTSS